MSAVSRRRANHAEVLDATKDGGDAVDVLNKVSKTNLDNNHKAGEGGRFSGTGAVEETQRQRSSSSSPVRAQRAQATRHVDQNGGW